MLEDEVKDQQASPQQNEDNAAAVSDEAPDEAPSEAPAEAPAETPAETPAKAAKEDTETQTDDSAQQTDDNAAEQSGDSDQQTDDAEVPPLPDFSGMLTEAAKSSIEMLNDVELTVKIELGRSELTVDEVLKLNNGSVVELNKLAGDPVDVLVNEQLVARGEVLIINDNFCVRLNEIVPGVTQLSLQNN